MDVSTASAPNEPRLRASDLLVWSAALASLGVCLAIVGHIFWQGAAALSWEFLAAAPESAGRAGGIAPILVSTALILGVCIVASLPVGLATAILLAEYADAGTIFGRLIRRSLDVLAAVPSIIFGMFGNAFFAKTLGLGFSILSGGLTLACMVLPLFIRVAEEAFRSVPAPHRLAVASLGFSRASAILRVLIPLAAPGILAGLVLAVGRAMAETAALLFTSGYSDRMPESLFDSGRALSIHIYDLAMNVPGGNANAHGSALVLIVLLLAINLLVSWFLHRFVKKGFHTP